MGLHYGKACYMDYEYTCFDGPAPEGVEPEIIQIGIVEVDTNILSVSRRASYYVLPHTGQISEYCTTLTGITYARLREEGRPLKEVVASLVKTFGPKNKVVYTWGSDDIGFRQISRATGVEHFPRRVDLGVQFRIEHAMDRNISLLDALTYVGSPTDGQAHDAGIDAMNTAALHMIMLNQRRRSPYVVGFTHALTCGGNRRFPVGYDDRCTCIISSLKSLLVWTPPSLA
jgi:inhibitor of KinA sporulation pathway (predicted exonuclease)